MAELVLNPDSPRNIKVIKYSDGPVHLYQPNETGKLDHVERDATLLHFGYDPKSYRDYRANPDGYIIDGSTAHNSAETEKPYMSIGDRFYKFRWELRQLPQRALISARAKTDTYLERIENNSNKKKIILGAIGAAAVLGAYWLGTRTGNSIEASDFNTLIDQNSELINQNFKLQNTLDQQQSALSSLADMNSQLKNNLSILTDQHSVLIDQHDSLADQLHSLSEQTADAIVPSSSPKANLDQLPWDVAHQLFPGAESQKINRAMQIYSDMHGVPAEWANGGQIRINGHIMSPSELPKFNKILSGL